MDEGPDNHENVRWCAEEKGFGTAICSSDCLRQGREVVLDTSGAGLTVVGEGQEIGFGVRQS